MRLNIKELTKDVLIAAAFFMLLWVAWVIKYSGVFFDSTEVAAEYGNIAEAIVQGKGFSNPFNIDSGPTAWMPPLYVYLIAAVFKIFGIKTAVSKLVILLIQYLLLSGSLYFLLKICDIIGLKNYKTLIFVFFTGLILLHHGHFVSSIHDFSLILFFSCISIYLFYNLEADSKSILFFLGLLSFSIPLTSPSLALSFFTLLLFILFERSIKFIRQNFLEQNRGIFKRDLINLFEHALITSRIWIFLLLFFSSVFLWSYRNYIVFEKFIPVKSNLWYDFHQANVLDSDGVLSMSTLILYHPYGIPEEKNIYKAMGEQKYMESYKEKSIAYLKQNPYNFLNKIINRTSFAFIYAKDAVDIDYIRSKKDFTPFELEKLASAGIYAHDTWVSLEWPQKEFINKLALLKLSREEMIYEEWLKSKQAFLATGRKPLYIISALLTTVIPFICILVGLFIPSLRRCKLFIYSALFYTCYLLPYVLVSHYERYQLPLIGLQSLLLFLISVHILKTIDKSIAKKSIIRQFT